MKFGKFKPCNEYHFEVEATLATILGIKPCNEYHLEGTEHYEFRFKNGYGASVIRGPYSYGGPDGLFELAVLKRNRRYPRYWDVTYDTPITSDVLGNLEVDDVVKVLEEISKLK